MIEKALVAETERLGKRYLDGARSLKEWRAIRPRLQREYLDMLGLWPVPERTPLKATVTGTLEHEGVAIENLHFQSSPGLYVTANLYRPKPPPAGLKKLPTILYVCGHSGRGRDGVKTAFQDHGMWFASNGYNCLIVDTLQLGEIPGVHHGTYGRPWLHLKAYGIKGKDVVEPRWWWHSAGYTPAGVECWNGMRAIDYLMTRPDVDAERIGVTGISGGGASTIWIAAADERVKVAIPVSGMSDLQCYVADRIVNGHCDCMFLHNAYQWDWTTIAALIAPRPLLFANSDKDSIFPMDGNRRIIDKLHTIYAKHGKADLVEEYVSKGGHDYRPDLRRAIFQFMNTHLKGDATTPVKDADFMPIAAKSLRVFTTNADLPRDAINHKVDEAFVSRAVVKLPEMGGFEAWRQDLFTQLKTRCLRDLDNPLGPANAFEDALLVGTGPSGPLIFIDKSDFDKLDFKAFAKVYAKAGTTALVYFPRFFALPAEFDATLPAENWLKWTAKSPPNYVERAHVLLGRTLDERRLHHLLVTVRKLARSEGPPKWDGRIVGKGQAGVIAAYAALFEPTIQEVILIDPPATHKEGPHFLNVLRVLDVPEALGLLAPRRLTIIGGGAAFERAAAIYRLAGSADNLTRK